MALAAESRKDFSIFNNPTIKQLNHQAIPLVTPFFLS
jgi:hypothetical protein